MHSAVIYFVLALKNILGLICYSNQDFGGMSGPRNGFIKQVKIKNEN